MRRVEKTPDYTRDLNVMADVREEIRRQDKMHEFAHAISRHVKSLPIDRPSFRFELIDCPCETQAQAAAEILK